MSVDILQQKKEEVAQSIIEDFKKELNFFQSTILSFFDKKITQTITTNVQLGSSIDDAKPKMNFIEKLLVQLSPNAAEKVFLFIKEKQEQIVKANTLEELENLKKWIIVPSNLKPENQPTQHPQQIDETISSQTQDSSRANKDQDKDKINPEIGRKNTNIIVWASTGIWLTISAKAIGQIDKLKQAKRLEETAKIEDPKSFLKKFEDLAEWLKKEKLNPKLTNQQVKMIDKSIKEFQNVSKNVDADTFSAVKMLQKLDRKLPTSILKSIDPADASKLAELINSDAKFVADLGDDKITVEAIQDILKNKWIKNISEDVIKGLKSMKWVEELQGAVHILTKLKGIRALSRGMRGVILLDLAFTWIDVWTLLEWLDGVELDAKINQLRASTTREHQRVQFGASLALTAISIIITCSAVGSAWGPIGTAIGAVLWVAGFAASQAIDIYYDAVEFYEQNTEDFKKQYRTEAKQAIIQSAASEEWNFNVSSRLYASVKKGGTSRAEYYLLPYGMLTAKKEPLTTTGDAWRALVWQEEYQNFPLIAKCFGSGKGEDAFIQKLSTEEKTTFKQQKDTLNGIINKRMEYIKNFMHEKKWTPEYLSFVAAMKNNLWIKAIENILTESKVYYQMWQTGPEQYIMGAKSPVEYKKLFGEKLKTEYPEGFATLEKLWITQPNMVIELHQSIVNTESMFKNSWADSEYDKKDKIPMMQKNLELIKKYYTYKTLDLPIEEQQKMEIWFRALDAKMVEWLLISGDFASIGALSWNKDQVKNYFIQDRSQDRRDTKIESSDSVWQNIIYRIAREIHWYEWHNTMKELIDFFREDKWSALWLYYSNGWKINNDRAIDKSISSEELRAMDTMSAEDIMKLRVSPSKRNAIFEIVLDPVPIKFTWISLFGFMDNAARLDTKADAGDMDKKMNIEYWTRLKNIIYQEKSYTAPETKKKIEATIIEYIKRYSQPVNGSNADWSINENALQEQWYIEMPYYLIMAAKKAKIGDIEKFLFKYENNKVIACTTKLYLDDKLDFSQTNTVITKEYVSWTSQNIWENTKKYIDYVDGSKIKFENLITYNVDDLDIPKEYLEIYQKKIKERETLKSSMLILNATTAKSKLESQYQEYYEYFENTYIAMLSVISKFGSSAFSSNDLDSATYHQQVEAIAYQIESISINDKWIITGPMDQLTKDQKKSFDAVALSQKVEGKSITELAKSKDETERKKAIRAVKQIMKSILEAEVLLFDAEWNIKNIWHGENVINLTLQLPKRLDTNITKSTYFDASKYVIEETTPDNSKTTIKTLEEHQKKVTTETNEIEKIIQSTEPDLVYPGRWLVTFDPETNLLASRGKKIKIDSENMTLDGLTTKFTTLKELVMTANLMNRFKYKYPWVKDFYFGSRMWSWMYYGIYRLESWVDTKIISLDSIKQKYPSMLDKNNNVKTECITYINSVT